VFSCGNRLKNDAQNYLRTLTSIAAQHPQAKIIAAAALPSRAGAAAAECRTGGVVSGQGRGDRVSRIATACDALEPCLHLGLCFRFRPQESDDQRSERADQKEGDNHAENADKSAHPIEKASVSQHIGDGRSGHKACSPGHHARTERGLWLCGRTRRWHGLRSGWPVWGGLGRI
jgi:hypothetical protein